MLRGWTLLPANAMRKTALGCQISIVLVKEIFFLSFVFSLDINSMRADVNFACSSIFHTE